MVQDRAGQTATSYDWADIEVDHPIDLAARQRIMAERMMISRLVLEAGFHAAPHTHHNEQISIVLDLFSPPSEKTGVDQS